MDNGSLWTANLGDVCPELQEDAPAFSDVVIIGAGYIIQAILLVVLVYIILRNSEHLLNYFEQHDEETDDDTVENVSN